LAMVLQFVDVRPVGGFSTTKYVRLKMYGRVSFHQARDTSDACFMNSVSCDAAAMICAARLTETTCPGWLGLSSCLGFLRFSMSYSVSWGNIADKIRSPLYVSSSLKRRIVVIQSRFTIQRSEFEMSPVVERNKKLVRNIATLERIIYRLRTPYY